ncbi:MAG: NAD(P)-dependent oxidoreductase [Bacteroidota bacterium]
MSKILVTGGLGTVGSVLVQTLTAKGHDVHVADLSHHHEGNYSRCDIGSFYQVERLLSKGKFDYVYNLAAEFGRWNGEDYYDTLWRSNAVGTKNIIRMQERLGFRLIHFSSSEVYGDYDGVMSEDVMDKYEVKQMNDYAMTKWVNEMQIMNSAQMYKTESVRVRLFNTYGPGEYYSPYRSVICLFIYRALFNIPYKVFLGHHRTSSYVTDTAATLSNIVENFKPGEVYNIGGTEYHDIKTVSDMIIKYLGKSDSFVEYVEHEPFTTKDKKVDLTKAIRDLKHNPVVKLEEGIPKTIEWMKSVYINDKDVIYPKFI